MCNVARCPYWNIIDNVKNEITQYVSSRTQILAAQKASGQFLYTVYLNPKAAYAGKCSTKI